MRFCLRAPAQSIRRNAWELQIRKSDTLNKDLIGADSQRRLEIGSAAVRDEVILFDPVATDAEATDQDRVPVERHAAGEEDDAALIRARWLKTLRARIGHVPQI